MLNQLSFRISLRGVALLIALFCAAALSGCASETPEKARFHTLVLNQMKYNRSILNETLAKIEKTGRANEIINWRPGGRAPIAFQLMHIAASDDVLLNGNLTAGTPVSAKYIAAYAAGKPSPRKHPTLKEIKKYLARTNANLAAYVRSIRFADLDKKPVAKAWGTTFEMTQSIMFHEAHHQGQAHITFNMYKAAKGLK